MEKQTIKIVAIAGSLRTESYNRKALQIAKNIARELGSEVTELDLLALDLPLFNEDLRQNGFPESVRKMKEAIAASDMLLIASPEYNHSISGVLKNAIDWASDKTNPFAGKTAAIFGASNGLFGTLRSQLHLRQVLAALSVELMPQPQVFIRSAKDAFTTDGALADPKLEKQLRLLIEETMKLVRRKQSSNN
jgi:chromate reductase, NAD(P)H dehydrogenase (quinone)